MWLLLKLLRAGFEPRREVGFAQDIWKLHGADFKNLRR